MCRIRQERPPNRKSSSQRITRAPARARSQCGGQSRRTATDDQQVASAVLSSYVVGIRELARLAKARGAADERLVELSQKADGHMKVL